MTDSDAKKEINTFLQDNKSTITPEMIKYINIQWEHFIPFFSRITPEYVKTLKNLAFPYYCRHKIDKSKPGKANNLYFQAEQGQPMTHQELKLLKKQSDSLKNDDNSF